MTIILKIFLGMLALITIGSLLIAYFARKSMIDGNNVGGLTEEDNRLEEFIREINSIK